LLGAEAIDEFDRLESGRPVLASAALSDSGIYVLADSDSETQLVIDAGPQGTATAGHGHADALSIWISRAGKPSLIDSGTCEYIGEGAERNAFRGTAAHNTLYVDGCDQAIPSGPFAWENLPKASVDTWIRGETFDFFAGCHDGYSRLAKPVIHRREVFWRKGRFCVVRDRAEGAGTHDLELRWHLPADFQQEGGWFSSAVTGSGIALLGTEGHGWSVRVENSIWSPVYGRKEAAPVVSFSTTAELPNAFVTLLVPRLEKAQQVGVLERVEVENVGVQAYRYRTSREEYSLVFSDSNEPWTVGPCVSDAEFLCFGAHQDGGRELIFCNGRHVEISGKPVVSCEEVVQRCELVHSETGTQMFSSADGGIVLQESLGDISFAKAGTT
jgi:hypothetical protein